GGRPGDTEFPLTVEYTKMNINNKPTTIPQGTIVYGWNRNNQLSFDSVGGDSASATLKKTLLAECQQLQSQVVFDNRKMKVGDEYKRETPLSVPVPGYNPFNMKITTIFKLVNVDGNLASFDITQKYTATTNQTSYKADVQGKGAGKMLYNTGYGCSLNYSLNSVMKMKFTLTNKTTIESTSKTGYEIVTYVKPAN
ncbi:MAG TPA: hypothetical protein VG603_06055, partial [Chitinophagales bacterium]|nr:hypothetical protein [Chitinophagales bacterium]